MTKIITLSQSDIDRFLKYVVTGKPNECWEWGGGYSGNGYGSFSIKRINYKATRVAYVVLKGIDPAELNVLHTCDNGKCINPLHLFLGTQQDNVDDMMQKGRHGKASQPGEKNAGHKLTEEKVAEIRIRYEERHPTISCLSREYGISRRQINRILNKFAWRYL